MTISKQKKQIDISPVFIVFLCAYYYFDPANSFVPFLFSVTAHEAGHLVALWGMRVPIERISLNACSAVLKTSLMTYRQELIAAFSGPAVNLLLFMILFQRLPMFSLVNLCLLCYNLLPFYPLDGGRILRASLHMLLSQRVARILEQCIMTIGIISLIGFSIYLTCVWHAGLWPVLLCAIILLKISGSGAKKELFCV